MTDLEKTLQEEFKLLWRSTRIERSRFILIQYNHYDLVRKVKADISTKYPNRKQHTFNLQKDLSIHFPNELLAITNGFVFVEHFDEILKSEHQKIAITLNQRRDAFRNKNTILLIFLPIGNQQLQNFSKILPDFYSIVSPIIQLVQAIEKSDSVSTFATAENSKYKNQEEAKIDINRIEKRLEELEDIITNKRLKLFLTFNLGKAYLFLGQYETAKNIFKNLQEDTQNTLEPTELNNIRAMYAWVEYRLGNSKVAANILENILEDDLKYYKSTDSVIAERQNDLAIVYGDLGRYEEAANLLEIALKADLNNFGENHPTIAIRQSNLANVYRNLGRYDEAANLLEIALQSDLNNFGENHPTVAIRQSNLANVYQNSGRYDEAANLLEIALKTAKNNLGENHPNVATSQSNLANVYLNLGRYKEAANLLEIALQSDLNNFGENHPTVGIKIWSLAAVYNQTKDYQKAILNYSRAYQILLSTLGENHPHTKLCKSHLESTKQIQS